MSNGNVGVNLSRWLDSQLDTVDGDRHKAMRDLGCGGTLEQDEPVSKWRSSPQLLCNPLACVSRGRELARAPPSERTNLCITLYSQ